MSDCQCLTGIPYEDKDGTCRCTLGNPIGGIKPIPGRGPILPIITAPTKPWTVLHSPLNDNRQPWQKPLTIINPAINPCLKMDAGKGYKFVMLSNGSCARIVDYDIDTTTTNITASTGAGLVTASTNLPEFIQKNKTLFGLAVVAGIGYMFMSSRGPAIKSREVTSVSKY